MSDDASTSRPESDPKPTLDHFDDPLAELTPEVAKAYPRNFLAMTLYSIFMRVGWIFKTESSIIPGFVTALTGNPVLIGMFPLMSRAMRFIPQFFFLGMIEHAPRKKPIVIMATMGLTVAWLAMAAFTFFGRGLSPMWLLGAFFVCYTAGWVFTGIEQITNRVLLGQLIPVRRRGRIIAIGGPIGSFSVLLSGPLVAYLLSREGAFPLNYALIFGLAGTFFAVTVFAQTLFKEPVAGTGSKEPLGLGDIFRSGKELFQRDENFRRIFLIAAVQSVSMYLFTFYVAYARTWSEEPEFGRSLGAMLGWGLTIQNVVIGALSLVMGLIVDWKGNRVVLRQMTAVVSAVPLVMVALGRFVPLESRVYSLLLIYALIGQMPVLQRIMSNYVLEIAPSDRQALYVGVWSGGQTITLVAPLLIGAGANLFQAWTTPKGAYEIVFVICSAFLYISFFLTWKLQEPRHSTPPAPRPPERDTI
ncbi:MAG: MFS transporter [Candidatus Poribacteria bacterium]|nr:MFS transporter [Candidatus Poribacteria bacterium]